MSILKANCPSCAAPLEFQKGSTIVLVCPFCRSAVARTDRGLADLGKVAEIVDSQSPLRLGLKGEFKGHRFELTGRAQNRHELGGVWDEWYATFSNGWVGWLAEAQGKFYLTFHQPLPSGATVPSFISLQIGQTLTGIGNQSALTVTEKGAAQAIAADGEIPYRLEPNEQTNYADLVGTDNAFATIDYSLNAPQIFVGKQVSLEEIGLANAKSVTREASRVSAQSINCPNCGGPLSLTAPDKAERVTCPNCNSLLDVGQGKLAWLGALKPPPNPPDFVLKTGTEGVFGEAKYRIIGAVVRSTTIDGIKYFWHEYLLYNPTRGFRWLIHSDNHWNFVEPVNPAEVVNSGSKVGFNGQNFKIFQDSNAVVEYVQGEFYWRVSQGETVRAIDYIGAPRMLSLETSPNEINWSLGTYKTNQEIEEALGVTDLPKPWSVAPNQPFTGSFYIKAGFAMLALLCVIAIFMIPLTGFSSVPLSQSISLPATASATTPQAAFSAPFDLRANRNVRITANTELNNSWADLDVDLINEQNSEVESINIPIEYYYGSDSDGSWTEGNKTQDASLSSLPAGKYTLRVEGTWEKFQEPITVNVKVEQNVTRGVNFCCAFIMLGLLPFFGLLRKIIFEQRRWSESMFNSNGTLKGSDSSDGGSDDDE